MNTKAIELPRNNKLSLLSDARYFQILFLGSFLVLVLFANDFPKEYLFQIGLTITSSLFFQLLFMHFTTKNYALWKSALITSLGLSLLLKVDALEWVLLATFISIGSKFLIKYNGKHVFNPANIGVVGTILLTHHAWISPGQWGSNIIYLFIIGSLGFLVIKKVARIDIALTFIATFGGLLFIRNILYLGWPIDFWTHQMTNGTLMLFTFFMITDPMTTPNNKKGRIVFALILAIIAFYLTTFNHFYAAPVWVLIFISPLTIVFDKIWKNKKYSW
ncbi:RnfABCDGE type electron transport complex subunit D [uncultured Flavobacterium sp.]|uniref:RnfABCDGE type electron transport complex subunit D n=1 Tax=uncultured Flavobacterium sp. TaxID=165435 RepID=UPI0030EB14A7|tara:strand:- start:50 stop:874 length:825 start_codon:yes stop_codon:yes gene_type:complete